MLRFLLACLIWASTACGGVQKKMVWPQDVGSENAVSPRESRGIPMYAQLQTIESVASDAQPMSEPERYEAHAVDCHCLQFVWPVPAVGINSLFGRRMDPIDGVVRYHAGVDLDAEYGAVVVSSAHGLIVEAGWHAGHGRRVVVEHAGGFQSVYAHLSQVLIAPGTRVRAGRAIGRVGNSGRSTGPHLHFEISRWGTRIDPLDLLDKTISLD